MTASRLILVEGWSDRIEVRPGDLVVALTAEGLQDLRDRRVDHVTPEQFGFNERLAEIERTLWPAELDWLERLGEIVAAGAPSQQVEARRFPWVYGWPLKSLVDRLMIANQECETVLEAAGGAPQSVWLYEDPDLEEAGGEVFSGWPDPSRARRVVWREIGRELGIPVTIESGVAKTFPRRLRLRRMVRSARALMRGLAPRFANTPSAPRDPIARFVFLHHSADTDAMFADLRDLNGDCFFAEEDGREVRLVRADGASPVYSRTIASAEWSADDGALEAYRPPFVAPRLLPPLRRALKTWLEARVPRYLARAAACRDLAREAGVAAVVTSHLTSDLQTAFVGAAAALPRTASVLVAHGDSPEVAPVWDLHELLPYDHYFVPNAEFAEYFRRRAAMLGRDTAQVHEGSRRWAEYRTWRQSPGPWLNRWDYSPPRLRRASPLRLGRKPVVVYVTSWVPAHLRYLCKPDYSDNFCHDLQVAICEALASARDIATVVKLYPHHRPNSAIERHLNKSRSPVHVSRAPMRHWFPRADAVIVDHPSTSLYQASMAGIPVFALLYSGFPFRDAAVADFAGQTASFTTAAEAGAAVRSYLREFPPSRAAVGPAFEVSDLGAQLLRLVRDPSPVASAMSAGMAMAAGERE